MAAERYTWRPIGVIHTAHSESAGTPIQPARAAGARGWIELDAELTTALKDLEGFERIWLLYFCDRAKPAELLVTPYMDTVPRGLFATRAPSRINPIGISPVRLLSIEGNRLEIGEVDMLDGTPLLDIKPYVPSFDSYPDSRHGWVERVQRTNPPGTADNRFEEDRKDGDSVK